jgi:hypothetical protein
VLSKPAAQGKAALDRLLSDLESRFFPSKRADVKVFLSAGPLAKPRESLLKNYLTVLLKDLIKQIDVDIERRQRAENALFVLRDMHPEPWKRLIPEILASVIPTLQLDEQLKKAVSFLGEKSGCELWIYVGDADRLRLSTFVQNYPGEDLSELEWFFEPASLPLRAAASSRIGKASQVELLDNSMWLSAPTAVIDRLLLIYSYKSNFADANDFAKRLRYHLTDSTEPQKHLSALIAAAAKNPQVRGSNQFPLLVKEFVEKAKLEKDKVKEALAAAGLEQPEW